MKSGSNNQIKLAEPVINSQEVANLTKKILKENFPNEGKLVRSFEKKISTLLRVKYALTSTSGTTAIFLGLKALNLKPNDEVLVPNITFQATANAVSLAGFKPVLVDVNHTNNLICLKSLKKKITNKTKVIIPVHVSGRGNNIKEICKIAKKNKIDVIEDSAEAFMSKYESKFLGTYGKIGCYSFAPNKIITMGQGGLIVTNDKKIYKKLLKLRDQGRTNSVMTGEDEYDTIGFNFKITNMQGALGISQLRDIKSRIKILKRNYKFYKDNLITNKNFKIIQFNIKKGEVPLWVDISCSKRNKLYNYLRNKEIYCRYYWKPLNTTKPYKKSFSTLPASKSLYGKLMWLPSSLKLTKKDLSKVCGYINKFIKQNY